LFALHPSAVSSTFLKVAPAAQAKKRPFSFCKAFSFGATYSKEKAIKEFWYL
jgi:hypothetical protein